MCNRYYDEFDPKRATMPFGSDNFCSQRCYDAYEAELEKAQNQRPWYETKYEDKIKPCPSCGSKAQIKNHDRDDPEVGLDFGVYNIECLNCHMQTKRVESNEINDIIKVWNRRCK